MPLARHLALMYSHPRLPIRLGDVYDHAGDEAPLEPDPRAGNEIDMLVGRKDELPVGIAERIEEMEQFLLAISPCRRRTGCRP